ncbi:MAG TPA: alpha/beta hydrolase [Pseudomonas sp.]|nr:alpha/beta hydrolase [Pseudomonas sp.]
MPHRLFFAHANGFPSETYRKLFALLEPDFHVHRLERHGHDPRYPVDANWNSLVAELIESLERLDGPVWGVGHSLGGILHYHAALRRPELYRGVVMLDAPLLTTLDRLAIRAAKRFGFIDRLTPAGRSLGRRECFGDAEEARRYFAGKRLFRRFDPDCLDDYVRHGLAPSEEGLRLRFDPATEITIYRNVPHRVPARPQSLAVPLAMVRGRDSRTVLPHQVRMVRRLPRGECLSVPGGHMFPLERPAHTAELVRNLLSRWEEQTP